MYVSTLRIDGLRGAHGFERDALGNEVELPAGPEGIAVADALTLFASSLDADRLPGALRSLGIASPADEVEVLEQHGFPVQASWPDASGLPPLLTPDGTRQVTVAADLILDPPLYGQLRTLAAREPRLVTALGQRPAIGAKVGWLFTRDLRTVSISLLHVRIGEVSFPTGSSDRPAWLPQILKEVAGRFGRVACAEVVDTVAARLLEDSLSPDPERRDGFQRAAEALAAPPFGLGKLELVRVEDRVRPCFGPHLLRDRQFGPAAHDALRLVEAVFLRAPDVLVVEGAGGSLPDRAAVRSWLVERTRGDGATLEQVFVAPGGAA